MALSKQQYDSYLESIKALANSGSAVIYCINNVNRTPELIFSPIYKEIVRLSEYSNEPTNEVMKKILMALLAKASEADIELANLRKMAIDMESGNGDRHKL